MKAYVLHNVNDFRIEDVDVPSVKEDEVLVSVKAAGICGSDIPRIYRDGTYSYPLIPGHEFSGQVVEAGGAAGMPWVGRRVGIFPLIPCFTCQPCQKQSYEMCKKYSYLGSRRDGGYAEYVSVPVWNLLELPDAVTYEQAAMLEPMAVAVHALHRSGIRPKDRVLVCGLGTIGLLIVMFLKEMGCSQVYAAGNKGFQRDFAAKLGVAPEDFCDVRREDVVQWAADKTMQEGIDVFLDCVGKNEILKQGIECASPGGTVMLVGNPASDVNLEKAVYWKVLRKQLRLQGTWNSSFTHSRDDDWNYALERIAQGRICPEMLITHRFPAEAMEQGFHIMRDKSEEYVKVMGVWDR